MNWSSNVSGRSATSASGSARPSRYLDSDTVFGVEESLVREFGLVDDGEEAATYDVAAPFRHADFTVVLEKASC